MLEGGGRKAVRRRQMKRDATERVPEASLDAWSSPISSPHGQSAVPVRLRTHRERRGRRRPDTGGPHASGGRVAESAEEGGSGRARPYDRGGAGPYAGQGGEVRARAGRGPGGDDRQEAPAAQARAGAVGARGRGRGGDRGGRGHPPQQGRRGCEHDPGGTIGRHGRHGRRWRGDRAAVPERAGKGVDPGGDRADRDPARRGGLARGGLHDPARGPSRSARRSTPQAFPARRARPFPPARPPCARGGKRAVARSSQKSSRRSSQRSSRW